MKNKIKLGDWFFITKGRNINYLCVMIKYKDDCYAAVTVNENKDARCVLGLAGGEGSQSVEKEIEFLKKKGYEFQKVKVEILVEDTGEE